MSRDSACFCLPQCLDCEIGFCCHYLLLLDTIPSTNRKNVDCLFAVWDAWVKSDKYVINLRDDRKYLEQKRTDLGKRSRNCRPWTRDAFLMEQFNATRTWVLVVQNSYRIRDSRTTGGPLKDEKWSLEIPHVFIVRNVSNYHSILQLFDFYSSWFKRLQPSKGLLIFQQSNVNFNYLPELNNCNCKLLKALYLFKKILLKNVFYWKYKQQNSLFYPFHVPLKTLNLHTKSVNHLF